jgi:murein DD-endopeptidase MepM/ murein hydrolase activator NlpD
LPEAGKAAAPAPKKEGVYHKVQKGQTLWRIAKEYGVSVEELISSNNIPNVAAIEVDQLIYIPGAKQEIKELPVYTEDQNKDEFAWPLKGKVIAYFNDPKGDAVNRGIDIETQEGEMVKAVREGKVVLASYMNGYGQTVMVDHGDNFISVYAQNAKLLVELGSRVNKGDAIAQVGRSGKRAFLHFELRKGVHATNPLYYLP